MPVTPKEKKVLKEKKSLLATQLSEALFLCTNQIWLGEIRCQMPHRTGMRIATVGYSGEYSSNQ